MFSAQQQMVNSNISTLQKIKSSGWNIFWAKKKERTNEQTNERDEHTVTITMGSISTESRTSYRVPVNVPKIDTLDDWNVGNGIFS